MPPSRATVVEGPVLSPVEGPLRQLTDQLNSSPIARLVGIPNPSAEAFAFAKIFSLLQPAWQIVYLVGSEREQDTAAAGLQAWSPPDNQRPIVAVPPITAGLLDRLQRHEPVILVAQQSAFAESLPHPNELDRQFLSWTVGQALTPTVIAQTLTAAGYEAEPSVSRPGHWTKRGEVVDVWPAESDYPYRLAFDLGTISQIMRRSSKSGEPVDTLRCPPVGMHDLDPRISLLAYLQPMRTLIVVPRLSLLESLPRGKDAVKQYRQLIVEPFGGEGAIKLDWRAAASYHGQWPLVAKDLARFTKDHYSIVIQSHRQTELTGQLKRQDIKLKSTNWIDVKALSHGFIAPSERFVYLTDLELFGRDERSRANRRRVEDVFLGDLEPGDFVVHLDHGIGKFNGMRLQHVNGYTKEYFIIEYAAGDRLYVPVETADKITRYIGSPHPKLHKLSGSSWAAVTKKNPAGRQRRR